MTVGESRDRTRSPHDEELFERLQHKLESLGVLTNPRRMRGVAERSMLRTLATRDRALLDPDGFARAHHGLARAFEAIVVNGTEPPTLSSRLGPLRSIMTPLVQLIANAIILGQTHAVFRNIRRMYVLREANAEWNSKEHQLLRRARLQMQLMSEDLGGSKLSIPIFLISGAFVSGMLSVARTLIAPALHDRLLSSVLLVVTVALLVGIAAIVLQGASIARMRLRMALKPPIDKLYQAIGSTGRPPRDRCFLVAIIALTFFVLAVIAIPSGVYLLLHV